ncbi:hexosaminidase [Pseudomonas phage EM]|uniref:Hexosaminidase n=1 Tax=Pseudomonas phage EM TaxID=2936914 RepID=A0AAE9KSW9_9CAUD|nr:hexosaminidase [Pseudomonas phage EM]UPW35809.1 hexosaminidase [Pseudomonas phage EM]
MRNNGKIKEIDITDYSTEDMYRLIAACRDNGVTVSANIEDDLMQFAAWSLDLRARSCTYIRDMDDKGAFLTYRSVYSSGEALLSITDPTQYTLVVPVIESVTKYSMELQPVTKVVYVGDVALTLEELGRCLPEEKLIALFGKL